MPGIHFLFFTIHVWTNSNEKLNFKCILHQLREPCHGQFTEVRKRRPSSISKINLIVIVIPNKYNAVILLNNNGYFKSQLVVFRVYHFLSFGTENTQKLFLGRHMSFYGATYAPLLETYMWCMFPEIHFWCDICQPLDGQHISWHFSYRHISEEVGCQIWLGDLLHSSPVR